MGSKSRALTVSRSLRDHLDLRAVALERAVALRDNRLRLRLGSHLADNRKLSGSGRSPKASRSSEIAFDLEAHGSSCSLRASRQFFE